MPITVTPTDLAAFNEEQKTDENRETLEAKGGKQWLLKALESHVDTNLDIQATVSWAKRA